MIIRHKSNLLKTSALATALCLSPVLAPAQTPNDTIAELSKKVEQQARILEQQARQLEQQQRELAEQRRQIQMLLQQKAGVSPQQEATAPASTPAQPAPAQPQMTQTQEPPADAATRPPEGRTDQDITIISDVGGVLTPRGTLTLEGILTASHTSSNRFFFQGVEIVDAVLIGAIEATESRRNYISPQIGARFGITNRMEASLKVPFVYRDDRVESTIISQNDTPGEPSFLQNLDGTGLGDIEFGMQYQLNDGRENWPFLVANLRAKSTTGKGPFEVDRNDVGLETELPTGSGFWSIEPSLTIIYQTDPAVFFTNFGYTWNMARDINVTAGNALIGRVNPGDSITASLGVGFALNDIFSMSIGYQHNYVFGTKSIINNNRISSQDFQVGSLLFGMSLGLGENTGLSMNVAVGVTEESPDVEFSLRIPFSFELYR
jgi:hypothetical protein